jgi:putative nucleotidyltransferase with HDIG domain
MTAERVLFVDDDRCVRAAFSRTLRGAGLETDVAEDAAAARAAAVPGKYAVIAVDYRLGSENGLDLIAELQAVHPLVSFILVTGFCDLDLTLEAVNHCGVSSIVTKPWGRDELVALLQRAISAHQERAQTFALQASAVDASRSLEAQKARLESAVGQSECLMAEILLGALDLRHFETRAHCQRVAAYAVAMAEEMGVAGHDLTSIRQGALLHDIGTIGVSDGIMLKPGPLTEEEWRAMREHCALGARLLEGFEELAGARRIVLEHHERWDGTGYPTGLRGEVISLGARIFAVADALEAMLSDRPYRPAFAFAEAAARILAGAGANFDPEVVAAFQRVNAATWLQVRARLADERPSTQRAA